MKIFKHIFLGLLFLVSMDNKSFAQARIQSFTEDPVKFLDEIETFFQSGNASKREVKDIMEQLTTTWKSEKFNDKYKQAAYRTCNLMLKKRLRPFPYFQSYLNSLMNFVNTDQSEEHFITWQDCIDKILNGKVIKNYSEYLSMSENLFSSNAFYKSPTVTWSSSNNDYAFEFDSLPKVVFHALNLRCTNAYSDSGVIYNTKGTYYPSLGKFIGNGGKVNWIKAGIDESNVFAELKGYQIILKTGSYTADSVTFHNNSYFNRPLLGTLTEKVIAENSEFSSYPRFDSYNKRLKINGLAENVDYDGGFSMRGGKLIGSGNEEEDAYLIFKKDGKPFLIAGSKSYTITKEKITAADASVRIFLEKDSIYHPGLSLRFIVKEKHLSLIRNEEGLSKTPFFDSYHAIDMYFEELSWKLDEPKIDFRMLIGNSQGEADFESSNYFKQDRYDRLQGMDEVNPLILIRDYIKSMGGSTEIYGYDLARFMRLSINQVRPMIVNLANKGFLMYEVDKDRIIVKDRLFQYITARAGKTDYDVIDFHSAIPGYDNANLNLLNNDLRIYGVARIQLSDSQNVAIYPKNREIILKKNRDFTFAGILNAGRFEFFGKEFSFEYDRFKINLTNVDSLRMKVQSRETDSEGNHPMVRVKTVIENINGELFIDNPANKSGVKDFAQYPTFISNKDSYAFYDKKSIQNGTYSRDNFYFHLEPFTIDSLDNFTNEGLNFKGEFASAGIFPQFKETLTLQSDYSLGFIRTTPSDGIALYEGKGTFFSQIKMSHEGLRGDGTINYVTSTTRSNDFIFYPDSMNTNAQSFDVKEQKEKIEFPQVKAEDVYVHWMPHKDLMTIYKKEKPFSCYDMQSEFNGRLDLSPGILTGDGIMNFADAELESKLIKFKQIQFNADTADFRLKSTDAANLAFSTNNVNAHIDFNSRTGDFKSNGAASIMRFPVNQYICYMDQFTWYMDKADIDLGLSKKNTEALKSNQDADLDLAGPEFISVHPKQDSLRFNALSAKYDVKKYIIYAKDVKYINVADARVYPNKGDVILEKNAAMRTLDSAKILANTITKYHNIYNATVNIFSRKNYAGSGYYDYVDEIKNKQSLYFSNISVDTTYQTYAETEIADSMKFMLSPNFEYKGKTRFTANKPFMNFTGVCKIKHTCDAVAATWIKFSADINPEQIYIPVSKEPTDIDNNKISAAIMLAPDSTHVYSAFLSKRKRKNDIEVLPAEGFLFFDKKLREYKISNKEKLIERAMTGNYLSLGINDCVVYGEGKLDLGADFGQVKMETVGNANHYLIPDSTSFDLIALLDFFFEENAMEKMAEAINDYPNLKPTDFSRQTYEKGLRELIGKEKADKLISQINLSGSFKKFPDELKKTIFFTDLKMKWNTPTKSYISEGKIGIGNINKIQINKFVDGRIEVMKKRGGDILNIYIELDGNNWFYFNYTRGLMQAISSNENFNTIIKELKSEKRTMKTEKKQTPYQFNLSTIRKKTDFLKKTDIIEQQ